MPRIDPVQLLNCLSILLSPNGGVKSRDEVQRIASLMTKFSKKLVSKCIYIQILKCTETELLGLFMGSGGWRLVHMWLTESIVAKNWPLVRELLELLLLCPVDIERLKTNNCPKLVKELSKDGNHFAIRALASKLVEQWLKTVKGETVTLVKVSDIQQIINDVLPDEKNEVKNDSNVVGSCSDTNLIKQEKNSEQEQASTVAKEENIVKEEKVDKPVPESDKIHASEVKSENYKEQETLPVLKISLRDGKQVISQLEESDSKSLEKKSLSEKEKSKSSSKSKDKSSASKSDSSKHKSESSHKHRSSSHRRDSPSRSNRDKSKDKNKHSPHSSKSSKHSSSSKKSSDKSTSSKSKDDKIFKEESKSKDSKHKETVKVEEQEEKAEKDISNRTSATLEKMQTPSISKLGKIPKLSDAKKEAPSISIEVRKPDEPKPKTVKTFNSKFRKHGLEEEIKPPPSRASLLNKKPSPVVPPLVSIPKRPSPVHNEPPPEKRPKTTEPVEKPGVIKLIPAKPKPMMLLESDMFMDALNASATNKKEPRKRKRRTSGSKDGSGPNDTSPPTTPTSTVSSPNSEKKSAPLRFYQDTLDAEEDKEKNSINEEENQKSPVPNDDDNSKEKSDTPSDTQEKERRTVNGLKSVLTYHKRKGPKKSIRWKPDSELEDIQYFELDETERVNVTKPFTDLKHMERRNEREAFLKGRNLANIDIMEEKTNWRPLIPLDSDGQIPVEHGKNSKESEIQAIRQKGTLQPLYFHKAMIPDTPAEPDLETHTYQEPVIIPLDDVTGNQDNVSDFRNMPWPEPKGNAPPSTATNINMAPMFTPNMPQFPNTFPNPQFGVPGFQVPPNIPPEWQNGMPPPHLMAQNNIPTGPMGASPMPPVMPPNMPHAIMMPPENMMVAPDMFNGPNQMFPPVPPDNFNMAQNMFPPNMNMVGPGMSAPEGMPGPGFRGPMRGRGSAGHWRGKGGPGAGWDGQQRGRGGLARGGRKTVCIYFQRKGSCRQGDNCSFLHPGVNCPY